MQTQGAQLLQLLQESTIHRPLLYLSLAVAGSFAVRLVSATLKAWQSWCDDEGFLGAFLDSLRGCGAGKTIDDYWFAWLLGVIEFAAYPMLMVSDNWELIFAWLGFKAVAQWSHWSESRPAFNRFLIGNALVVILSVLVLTRLVAAPGRSGVQGAVGTTPAISAK